MLLYMVSPEVDYAALVGFKDLQNLTENKRNNLSFFVDPFTRDTILHGAYCSQLNWITTISIKVNLHIYTRKVQMSTQHITKYCTSAIITALKLNS
jgi:hypothetical protein